MNKERKSGMVMIDARGIMIGKPWKATYKDIYSQVGHTAYQASHAHDIGIELTELAAPSITTGSTIQPIAFVQRESDVAAGEISAVTP